MRQVPFRQVHLDFHVSEHILNVAENFDADGFAQQMHDAHVDSVTCFARCHHGWLYYESAEQPGRMHPELVNRDLLSEQVSALHARGIRAPIYTTVQWDQASADAHPEWLVVDANGCPSAGVFDATFRRNLCVNTPYRAFLKSHVAELLAAFDADGLFFDIVKVLDCSCRWCRDGMRQEGYDAVNRHERLAYARQVLADFKLDMSAFVRGIRPDCDIFYNQGHVDPGIKTSLSSYSHIEVESLPTGGWGYDHFPVTARYARTLRKPLLGMTGKFHTHWGDFHSFKNREALRFECMHMIALGAACSIGDQLLPDGTLCPETYRLIGAVYAEIEQKEPWCRDAQAVADIAVINPEGHPNMSDDQRATDALRGVYRILIEGGHQFDIVDSEVDLDSYKLVLLPDEVRVDAQLAGKIEKFIQAGGWLLASYDSGLGRDDSADISGLLGISTSGYSPHQPDFIVPGIIVGDGLPNVEHVMYRPGVTSNALSGTSILAEAYPPYFNRTWEHYMSHMHAPADRARGSYPVVFQNERAIYFSHPVFSQYADSAPFWVKRIVLNAIDRLLPEPKLRHDGPGSLIATVTSRDNGVQELVHLIHYIPESRCKDILLVEDAVLLHDVEISVRASGTVKTVTLVPQNSPVEFSIEGDRVVFQVNRIHGHQMIEICY